MSERKSKQELDSADEVIRDYSLPNSWVDQGNLFFAATEYRNAYKELQEKLSVARAALENIAKGTHEEFPTCMIGKNGFDYGPPRTGGWEGWARELRACNIEIAREALEKIKVT